MILRRNINVIYIQKNTAIGLFHDFAQEFPLRHFGGVVLCITADVLDADRHFEKVARGLDLLCGMPGHSKSVRHRQQVMGIAAVDASPAQMIRKPGRIGVFHQLFQALEMLSVKLVGRAEIDCHTMLDDPVLFENRVEHLQRAASVDHEIFRDYFKPIDNGLFRENVPVMGNAQADADTVFRKSIESVSGHNLWDFLTNELPVAWEGTDSISS